MTIGNRILEHIRFRIGSDIRDSIRYPFVRFDPREYFMICRALYSRSAHMVYLHHRAHRYFPHLVNVVFDVLLAY